jgi:hypothetical protein
MAPMAFCKKDKPVLHGVRVEGGNAHDDIGVAVDILGDRVDDDIRAMVERVLHIRAEEGVVDHHQYAVLVSLGGYGSDIHEAERGVGWGLDPDEFGLRG